MASYRGHLTLSSAVGIVYGGAGVNPLEFDPATALLAAGVTAVGGMLPDLDSNSGRPVREMFSLAATFAALMIMPRLHFTTFSQEESLVVMGLMYIFIRYGLSRIFNRLTVHRGMFHSIPAMLIAGLLMYLTYSHAKVSVRIYLACGVMLGFLSHLVLDELFSVNFEGVTIRLNSYAGSALKFFSPSKIATCTTYLLLVGLSYVAYHDFTRSRRYQLPDLESVNILKPTSDWEKLIPVGRQPLAVSGFSSNNRTYVP
jgi:membrane-bound metal-dependent hydrolase YbcI (DUF457 family)